MLGQLAEGLKCLAEAAAIIETSEERYAQAELHRVHGDLLNSAGDQTGAERHYRQAVAIAERQSAKLFQLRASTSLARLWCDQGKRTEARDLLAPIYNWFTEGFDAPDLRGGRVMMTAGSGRRFQFSNRWGIAQSEAASRTSNGLRGP